MQRARDILQNTFGYPEFRHQQAAIIETVLSGQHALVLMPTGGGKSLCYQIPALIRSGVAVVVSPLIALMHDQVASLQQLEIKAAYLNSSMPFEEQQAVEKRVIDGDLDLLYISPERLLTQHCLRLLKGCQLALFAIDEAHCVSQWGHDFRPEYQQLSKLLALFPETPRIALTATADQRTRQEIKKQLGLEGAASFISSFDRPNIRYHISEQANAKEHLWRFISLHHATDTGIVYCLSRKKVESISAWLQEKGRQALPYHAGLSAAIRADHQQRFLQEDNIIIVATIAFGMGIDKPNVRFVAHLNLPKNIEAYYQETGRAGRDGATANAWLNYGLQDVITLRKMLAESNASSVHKRVVQNKLDALLAMCESITCRRQVLLDYFSEYNTAPCGNCDNCLTPPQTWNATVAAQKALSSVYRTQQRFGVSYLIDVLRGKEDSRIIDNAHNEVSTFGIGTELSVYQWKTIFRQLVAQGYLHVNLQAFGALELTQSAKAILKGETEFIARKIDKSVISQHNKTSKESKLNTADKVLFDALKDLRRQQAAEQNVPPYYIFHDASLEEMCVKRPQTPKAFKYITGVGEHKLQRYGRVFLEEIARYKLPLLLVNNLSETVNSTLSLFLDGLSADTIAAQRDLSTETIYGHFAQAIECGLLDYRQVLKISAAQAQNIIKYANHLEISPQTSLKPLYEVLEGRWSYNELRCVINST